MEAHAIRETAHVTNGKLNILLPDWINGKDVDVIILPKAGTTAPNIIDRRVPDLFAGRGDFQIADDFNDELPASFGKQGWSNY